MMMMMRCRSFVSIFLRLCKWLAVSLLTLLCAWLVTKFLLVPVLLFFDPSKDPLVYDLGFYGIFPQRHYKSFHLPSPDARSVVWESPICDYDNDIGGLVSLDNHGPKAGNEGPMLLDLAGNLIWRDTSFGAYAMNVKVQTWRGEPYLTFWAGAEEKGNFYMLDSGFNLVHNVSVVGDGVYGDPHEFKITPEDTALAIIYNLTDIDVSHTELPLSKAGWYDAMFQEVDIETGELLFQWRSSDHLLPEDGEYLRWTFDADPHAQGGGLFSKWGAPLEYYHFNSVDKDSDGNYLLSIRFTHQVLCISSETGEILWGLGGKSADFQDLSDGKALSFQWQHDARWIDEENGIFGLFDNGIKHGNMVDAWHSRGMIIHLDPANRTARHLHDYPSSAGIRSLSQGSFQYLPAAAPENGRKSSDQVFIGWGSAGAYSLHSVESEEVLCETHFVPTLFHPFGPVESYRVYRAPPSWTARPSSWDPNAVVYGDAVYVSWNGGMEVRHWILQKAMTSNLHEAVETWKDVAAVDRDGFESRIDIPQSGEEGIFPSALYRVVALDAANDVLRYSNTVEYLPVAQSAVFWFWVGVATPIVLLTLYAFVRRRDRWSFLKGWTRSSRSSGRSSWGYAQLLSRR